MGKLFRSNFELIVSVKEKGGEKWEKIGETPGEIEVPNGYEIKVATKTKDEYELGILLEEIEREPNLRGIDLVNTNGLACD